MLEQNTAIDFYSNLSENEKKISNQITELLVGLCIQDATRLLENIKRGICYTTFIK